MTVSRKTYQTENEMLGGQTIVVCKEEARGAISGVGAMLTKCVLQQHHSMQILQDYACIAGSPRAKVQ